MYFINLHWAGLLRMQEARGLDNGIEKMEEAVVGLVTVVGEALR
jgi:hypothetical protein